MQLLFECASAKCTTRVALFLGALALRMELVVLQCARAKCTTRVVLFYVLRLGSIQSSLKRFPLINK